MPQIQREFTVEDVIPWSYLMTPGEVCHAGTLGCWLPSPHPGTALTYADRYKWPSGNGGTTTKATETTCSRVGRWTCVARPLLGCSKDTGALQPSSEGRGCPGVWAQSTDALSKGCRQRLQLRTRMPRVWLNSPFYRVIPGPGEIGAVSQMGIFHCRCWYNNYGVWKGTPQLLAHTRLSPPETTFFFVAMSHLDGLEKQPWLVTQESIPLFTDQILGFVHLHRDLLGS